jgi:hypothetical protein
MEKSHVRTAAIVILALIMCSMVGCGKDQGTNALPPAPQPPFQKVVQVSGNLQISGNSTLALDELELNTMAATGAIDSQGAFSIGVPECNKQQVMLFNSKATGDPIYLGLYDPLTETVMANDTSTALALALFNPFLIKTDQAMRQEYLNAIKASPGFGELLSLLNAAYDQNAEGALSFDENPLMYQALAELMKEAMETLGQRYALRAPAVPQATAPYIEGAPNTGISFVNPTHVWYAAGIFPDDGQNQSAVVTIDRVEKIVEMHWGWPPVVITEPAETPHALNDGFYRISLYQGYDFSKIAQFQDDPLGRATLYNTVQTVAYLVDLVLGIAKVPDFISLPKYVNISADRAHQFSEAIIKGDMSSFLATFSKWVVDNSEAIAYWYWQDAQNDAATHFMKAAGGILGNVCTVLKVLGFANEQAPFFWDMAFAPHEVTYFITLLGGEITSTERDDPPLAAFIITPPAGIVGTVFSYDASSSSDDFDPLASLSFRWDFEGDGNWDTEWSTDCTATNSYTENGAYQVTLQAKDTHDHISTVSKNLSVGGGAGTASHVKLFRDHISWWRYDAPWNIDATVAVLQNLGFTEGVSGENTYEIISSDQFATGPMVPGEDLVIIANDQDQDFYNRYAAAQVRFNSFVNAGGSLLWEACDEGWQEGSMADAGVELPGGVTIVTYYDYHNYVIMQNLPLVAGLPYELDHNYASHEGFLNLPEGTTVYCTATNGEPTLIEFNFGAGWIIMTGQPLEHQYKYIYGNPDMENLLPRIIAYFTGKNAPGAGLEMARTRSLKAGAASPPMRGQAIPSSSHHKSGAAK